MVDRNSVTTFAWVIEAPTATVPLYWDGGDWSSNHHRAIRYARQVDAERAMINLTDGDGRVDGMKAAEHGWVDGRLVAADQPSHQERGT